MDIGKILYTQKKIKIRNIYSKINQEDILKKWKLYIQKDEKSKRFILQVYIPFCGQTCTFCNCYYIGKWNREILESYMKLIEKTMIRYKNTFKNVTFHRVFFSGGSFASVGLNNLNKIFDLVKTHFNIQKNPYIFFEGDVHFLGKNEKIYKAIESNFGNNVGVSLGVQTTNPDILKILKRRQTNEQIKNVVDTCKKYGFKIKLDLICGLEGESFESFKTSLHYIYKLDPDNIHIYNFDPSSNTIFSKENKKLEMENYVLMHKMSEYAYTYLKNNSKGVTQFVSNGSGYETINYFKYKEMLKDCLEWQDFSSVLTIGHGKNSIIWGEGEYNSRSQGTNFESFTFHFLEKNLKGHLIDLFITRFGEKEEICFDAFEKILPTENISNILKEEINFLKEKGKIIIKNGNTIQFTFNNTLEIYLYASIIKSGYHSKKTIHNKN